MTQKDKELLLKDLCGRLLYGVMCGDMEGKIRPLFGITPTQHFIVTLDNAIDGTNGLKFSTIDCVKPYLRPMSSMTDDEVKLEREIQQDCLFGRKPLIVLTDFYYSRHIDINDLIEKGLALEVIEGIYQ